MHAIDNSSERENILSQIMGTSTWPKVWVLEIRNGSYYVSMTKNPINARILHGGEDEVKSLRNITIISTIT